jgi:hypothetical protein
VREWIEEQLAWFLWIKPVKLFFVEEINDENDEKVDINRTDGTADGTADFRYP